MRSIKAWAFCAAVNLLPLSVALAHGDDNSPNGGWEHMMGWSYGGMFMWLLFIAIVVLGIYFIARGNKPTKTGGYSGIAPEESALEILKRRYAQGEIDREEFEKIKKDLES